MKIYGICVVKNEEDIIRECLEHASAFCAKIFVYDTGSNDKTWNIVKDLSRRNIVVPFKKEYVSFKNGLRNALFNKYKSIVKPEDWWYILDADEFLEGDPHVFIKNKVRRYETVVWCKHISFYYTEKDYEKWKTNKENLHSRNISVASRRRYYKCDTSEPRLFKHRQGIVWEEDNSVPSRIGVVAEKRIAIRHYKWRDPKQILTRMKTRKDVNVNIEKSWKDIDLNRFDSHIAASKDLFFYNGKKEYTINEKTLPNHLEKPWRRIVKRMLYYFIYKRKYAKGI